VLQGKPHAIGTHRPSAGSGVSRGCPEASGILLRCRARATRLRTRRALQICGAQPHLSRAMHEVAQSEERKRLWGAKDGVVTPNLARSQEAFP
jgi:hypothetical protein